MCVCCTSRLTCLIHSDKLQAGFQSQKCYMLYCIYVDQRIKEDTAVISTVIYYSKFIHHKFFFRFSNCQHISRKLDRYTLVSLFIEVSFSFFILFRESRDQYRIFTADISETRSKIQKSPKNSRVFEEQRHFIFHYSLFHFKKAICGCVEDDSVLNEKIYWTSKSQDLPSINSFIFRLSIEHTINMSLVLPAIIHFRRDQIFRRNNYFFND